MFDYLIIVLMGLQGVALLLSSLRLLSGPTMLDRFVALDLIGVQGVGLLVLYVLAVRQPMLLDVVFFVVVISIVGIVAAMRSIERGGHS